MGELGRAIAIVGFVGLLVFGWVVAAPEHLIYPTDDPAVRHAGELTPEAADAVVTRIFTPGAGHLRKVAKGPDGSSCGYWSDASGKYAIFFGPDHSYDVARADTPRGEMLASCRR